MGIFDKKNQSNVKTEHEFLNSSSCVLGRYCISTNEKLGAT